MWRIAILVLALVWLGACRESSQPEKALNAYAAALRERRCGEALELLSARTRYSLDALRIKPQNPHTSVPLEEYYCSIFTFEDCKLNEMSVKASDGATATVTMPCGRTQDSFLPGFPSMFLKYEPRDWELVREEGHWRMVLPFVIKIVEVREREDQLREKALQDQRAILDRRAKKDSK